MLMWIPFSGVSVCLVNQLISKYIQVSLTRPSCELLLNQINIHTHSHTLSFIEGIELARSRVYLSYFKIMKSCFIITAYVMAILPPKHLDNAFTSL